MMMLVGCVLGTLVSNVARYAAGPRPTEASRANIGKTSNNKGGSMWVRRKEYDREVAYLKSLIQDARDENWRLEKRFNKACAALGIEIVERPPEMVAYLTRNPFPQDDDE